MSISPYADPAIPKHMCFGTANKLGLIGVLRFPIFSLRFQFIPPLLTNTPPYCCRDEEVVRSSHCLCDPRIPKRMRFGTANKLGLVGVLRERCSLVELPTFALRTRLS